MAQIKKDTSLRKAILQAAITGQLISDVEGESLPLAPASKLSSATPSAGDTPATPPETGKQLLDRIIEERNKKLLAEWEEALKRNPKAKKPAPVVASEIDEDEIPFEIPENWCWCRLGDLVTILGDGLHGTPQYDVSGDYYFVNGNNLNNGLIEIKPDTKKVNEKEFEKYKKDLNDSTIFVSINGTIGNIAFYNNEKIILGKSACYFNVAIKELKQYFFYLFQSDFFLTYALDNATGTTIKNVGLGTMRDFVLPLPPLAVQNAIVAKLDQVLPLVDAYENAVLQKEELKSTLSDKVKKAILQEAITGKLTESWRKSATITETGKQLLDRIISERNAKALADWEEKVKENPKAKKPVLVVASEIEEDEIPFEVPEGWCWCRLGDVFEKITDGTHKTPKYLPSGVPFLSVKDMSSGKLEFSHTKFISEEEHEELYKRCNPEYGDLLITKVGTTGIPVIVDTDKIFDLFVSVALCKPVGNILDMKFMVAFINSPFVQEQIDRDTIGSANKNWVIDKIVNTVIPLPPLEEQERIISTVEQLLSICR